MKFSSGLISCVAGLCIAGFSAAAEPPPETYTFNMSPPQKVGDIYHLISKSIDNKDEVMSRSRFKGNDKHEETIELDGIVRVRKIDSHGNATMLECTVKHLRVIYEGSTSDVVPPGSVISTQTAPLAGDKYQRFVTTQSPVPLHPGQIEMINQVFQAKMPEAPTDQDIFGTATPQPIGSTWALNRARGVQYWSSLSVAVEPRDFSGKSQLIGIEKIGDVECFRVEGAMKAPKFISTVNANVHTEKAAISMKYSMLVPRKPSLFSKITLQSHVELSEKGVDDNSQGFRRELVEDVTKELRTEPVK